MSDALHDRFTPLVALDDNSDWSDVLRRAGLARRRWTIVAICVAFVFGIAAASFVGIRLHAASAAVPGPGHVQKKAKVGTVRWLFAHEPRGESLAQAHIPLLSTTGSHWQPVKFARVVVPDPALRDRLVVSLIGKRGRNICMTVFSRLGDVGGGCAIGLDLRPFSYMTMSGLDVAPDNGEIIAGMASDDVARLEVFMPGGRHRGVPLVDNTFALALTANDYPSNLVAYDRSGLVIGRSAGHAPHYLG